jgi:hypothetical protein
VPQEFPRRILAHPGRPPGADTEVRLSAAPLVGLR